jgi:hypothetical protein
MPIGSGGRLAFRKYIVSLSASYFKMYLIFKADLEIRGLLFFRNCMPNNTAGRWAFRKYIVSLSASYLKKYLIFK